MLVGCLIVVNSCLIVVCGFEWCEKLMIGKLVSCVMLSGWLLSLRCGFVV